MMTVLDKKIEIHGPDAFREAIQAAVAPLSLSVVHESRFDPISVSSRILEGGADYYVLDVSEYVFDNPSREGTDELKERLKEAMSEADPKSLVLSASYFKDGPSENGRTNSLLKRLYFDLCCMSPGIDLLSGIRYPNPDALSEDSKESLPQKVKETFGLKFSGILDDFTLDYSLENGTIKASIALGKTLADRPKSEFRFAFYIIKDSKVLKKIGPSPEDHIEEEVTEPGAYLIQGYVYCRKNSAYVRSDVRFHVTEELEKEFEGFLEAPAEDPGQLRIEKMKAPFQDFLVVGGFGDVSLESLAEEYGLGSSVKAGDATCYSDSIRSCDGRRLILSGFIKDQGRVRFADEPGFPEDLDKQPGSYSYVEITDDTIQISNDLLGFSHIWYHLSGKRYIVSNRYSLLVKAMKELGLKPEMDWGMAFAQMSNMSSFVYHQAISHDMCVKGVSLLPINRTIRIIEGSPLVSYNSIAEVLDSKVSLDYDRYEEMRKEALREVKDNICAAIDDPRFDLMVDLTGGMDSRLIYGLLTGMPGTKPKVLVNTRGSADNADVRIATKVNSLCKYDYDSVPEDKSICSFAEADALYREHNMGQLFSHGSNAYRTSKLRCKLNGGAGDALCRSVYSRHLYGTPAEYARDAEGMCRHFMTWMASTKLFGDPDAGMDVQRILEKELRSLPGASPMERMERMYLFFRNPTHFDPYLDYIANVMHWMPLQSRALLALNHQTHDIVRGIKLELDLLEDVNPALLYLDFEREQDNIDRKHYQELFPSDNPWIASMCPDTDTMDMRTEAQAAKKIKLLNKKDPLLNDPELINRLLENDLRVLSKLGINRTACIALYYWMKGPNSKGKILFAYNKVASALDQARLCGILP